MATTPEIPSADSIAPVSAVDGKAAPRATGNSGQVLARVKPKTVSDKAASRPLKRAPKWATTVVVHQDAIDELTKRKQSPAGKFLLSEGRKALAKIKLEAPIAKRVHHKRAPGYLRRNIVLYLGQEPDGTLYAEIATRARANDGDRAYYGRIQNQKGRNQGYMRRGLRNAGG